MSVLISYGLPALFVTICSVGRSAELCHTEGACGRRIEEPSAVYGSEVRIDIVCRIEFFETAARLQDKHYDKNE
jgi:hypothetical protein